jgi:oligopeptide/dipeptide ABC transporter ATP-binding protein
VEPLLQVENLSVHFGSSRARASRRKQGVLKAVDDVTFSIAKGEVLGLVGESGCGKSTVSRALLRLVPLTGGKVIFNGRDLAVLSPKTLRAEREKLQMVFQDPYASLNPSMTVEQTISELLLIHRGGSRAQRREQVGQILREVELAPEFMSRYPHEFSGGQRQRICIARALVLHPDLVVADEPVSSLDVSIQAQIINLLQELQEKHQLTYLFISHDLSVVRHISRHVAIMYLGRIVELADTAQIYSDPLHPYAQALLSAVPVPDPDVERSRKRILLTGEVPSGYELPRGCRFNTRCWRRMDICQEVEPVLRETRPGHCVACHLY